jgi:hypothetical protein
VSIAASITSTARRLVTDAARDVLLGISTYAKPKPSAIGLDLDRIEDYRQLMAGGLLQPATVTRSRWYLEDIEIAEHLADQGDLRLAAQLMGAARRDGHLAGVLSTRTGGLVRLPRQFRGDPEVIAMLERGHTTTRSCFDEMLPPSELSLLAADGLLVGAGVAELIPVRGRRYPVLVRLDPQYLRFMWSENRWFYQSVFGLVPITPGDGRWVLYTPGGRVAPWSTGLWRAVGSAWIRKHHAALYKDHWEMKLAHPARVAHAPPGASEEQRANVFQQLMAWGLNTVFALPVGYEATLLESNGRGWESFVKTIEASNEEYKIAVCGQSVTVDGGAGFSNSDIHKSIRADLIKESADTLAHCLNTQALTAFVSCMWGADAVLSRPVAVEWDVTPPKDRNSEAMALSAFAQAVTALTTALAPSGLAPNVQQLVDRYHVPTIRVTASIVQPADADALPAPPPSAPVTPQLPAPPEAA